MMQLFYHKQVQFRGYFKHKIQKTKQTIKQRKQKHLTKQQQQNTWQTALSNISKNIYIYLYTNFALKNPLKS